MSRSRRKGTVVAMDPGIVLRTVGGVLHVDLVGIDRATMDDPRLRQGVYAALTLLGVQASAALRELNTHPDVTNPCDDVPPVKVDIPVTYRGDLTAHIVVTWQPAVPADGEQVRRTIERHIRAESTGHVIDGSNINIVVTIGPGSRTAATSGDHGVPIVLPLAFGAALGICYILIRAKFRRRA